MGDSLSFVALRCEDAGPALAALQLERTGESCEFARKPMTSCALPRGWYLVVANRCDHRMLGAEVLRPLSEKYEVVAWSLEEHVMFSAAEQWTAGRRIWRAEHSGEDGPVNLKASGTLPAFFEPMAAAIAAEQDAHGGRDADVDHYFEIPLVAARELTGFKHDERRLGVDFTRFERLRETVAGRAARPWWRFWA